MIKLNDNSIFTGQIKQLLHTFNLPLCQIGDSNPKAGKTFIKGRGIFYWKDIDGNNNLKPIFYDFYKYGENYLNLTSNLRISNMLYDRPTHRYLGKYLRFLRDYKNINLMSMYNCCDQDNVNSVDLQFQVAGVDVDFRTQKSGYIIYKIPIKLSPLTLGIQTPTAIEICLFIDTAQQVYADTVKMIASYSYMKARLPAVTYYNPIELIKTNMPSSQNYQDIETFIENYPEDTYLLIRAPISLKNSIVVLEGDFTQKAYVDSEYFTYHPHPLEIDYLEESRDRILADSEQAYDNAFIIDHEDTEAEKARVNAIPHHINPQLLSNENATSNYLLADKLIEYLTENATTPLNQPYEIKRWQKALTATAVHRDQSGTLVPYTAKPENYRYGIPAECDQQNTLSLIYKNQLQTKYDMLGFLDKEIETKIKDAIDNAVI